MTRKHLSHALLSTALLATFAVGVVTNAPVVSADCSPTQWGNGCKDGPAKPEVPPVAGEDPSGESVSDGIAGVLRGLLRLVFG